MMKLMYFWTLLIVFLCILPNLHGAAEGLWYSYAAIWFISVLFFIVLIFGIVHWKEL